MEANKAARVLDDVDGCEICLTKGSALGILSDDATLTGVFGRIAQRESTCLTRRGSQVQTLFRPPMRTRRRGVAGLTYVPVTHEIAGSNPVASAILSQEVYWLG